MLEFLQIAGLSDEALLGGVLAGVGTALLIVYFLVLIALYVYSALAFSRIATKAGKEDKRWIAWIPGVGPAILSNIISEKHWWPWLLLIGFWIPFLNIALIIAFAVFSIIWMWKTYEAVGRPGWWAIMPIIPIVGWILNLVFIGIAAWGNSGQQTLNTSMNSQARPVKQVKPLKR